KGHVRIAKFGRRLILDLEDRFGRIAARSVSVHDRQRFKAQPRGPVVFADLHEATATLAPFRKFSAIYTVVEVHTTSCVLIGWVDMPMGFDIGRLIPSALKYLPMSDAFNLTCQTQFDGLAPEKRGITWISRPIGASNGR